MRSSLIGLKEHSLSLCFRHLSLSDCKNFNQGIKILHAVLLNHITLSECDKYAFFSFDFLSAELGKVFTYTHIFGEAVGVSQVSEIVARLAQKLVQLVHSSAQALNASLGLLPAQT